MPQLFTGLLNANEIFGSIFNQIISQHVFADNIKGTYSELVDAARVDGSLYGDTKLYYSTDIYGSDEWTGDPMGAADRLIGAKRPEDPKCQKIEIDTFRQIKITIDDYLSKRAWGTPDAFIQFNSRILSWMRDIKRVYDATLYNTYIGTTETTKGKQKITITPISGQNDALTMAEALADLLVKLKCPSRDYNDYGFMRSLSEDDMRVVWNAKHYNTLKKIDMPTIFHTDGLLTEFDQTVLPAQFFGTIIGTNHSTMFTVPEDSNEYYSTVEKDITVSNQKIHIFPGIDKLPVGAQLPQDEVYKVDDSIAFKVMHKESVPYMSAFEVGTSFFNDSGLYRNHFLTWGHNKLEYLMEYPLITARFAQ